jgi:hypothetical protein
MNTETATQTQSGFVWAGDVDGVLGMRWQNGNVWIVEYEFHQGYPRKHYICYRSVERVPAGRKPWTVDNRRINNDPIFSLGGAMDLATAFINKQMETAK